MAHGCMIGLDNSKYYFRIPWSCVLLVEEIDVKFQKLKEVNKR
jgi:hypothetical protein